MGQASAFCGALCLGLGELKREPDMTSVLRKFTAWRAEGRWDPTKQRITVLTWKMSRGVGLMVFHLRDQGLCETHAQRTW